MLKKMEAFDTDKIISATAKANEAEIVDLVFQEQLYEKGVMTDGSDTPEYTPFTEQYKSNAPPGHDRKTDHMTFKDEGGFYSGGYLVVRRKSFSVDSKDSKRDELVNTYGDMLGLTKESLEFTIKEYFKPAIQEAAKKVA